MNKIFTNSRKTFLFLVISLVSIKAFSQAVTIALGSGTVVPSNSTAGPINQYYKSTHCQMVYTAAEINGAGITAGSISKLGFYIETAPTYSLPNYTIKIKHTTAANVASYDGAGLTTIYSNSAYSPVVGGFNMLPLITPFVWNGVDNILVDVCFDLSSDYSSSGQVRVYDPAVTDGFLYIQNDNTSQCGVACNSTSTDKPQIQFEFILPSPTDLGVTAVLKPLGSKKCFGNDTIVAQITNLGTDPLDFTVNPATITVKSTGANVSTYTLLVNNGFINTNTSQVYTITTAYNMSNLGTYNLKAYTSISGDGSALNDTLAITRTKTAFFTTSFLPNDTVCQTLPVQLKANFSNIKQVGTGSLTNSSTSYPAPYGNFYEGAKHHFLILASELSSSGLIAGNISSIAFNATNLNGTDPLINYNIAIATTTVSNLTAFSTQPFTTYFSSPSYTPVIGINNQVLSTPFTWDGVSNLVIETCFNNVPNGFSSNVSVSQSATAFTSSVWYRADNVSTVCTNTTLTSTDTQRPNFYFTQTLPTTYSWSPSSFLSATNINNPIATLNNSQTYSVSVNVNGCLSYDTMRVTIKPASVPKLGNDTTLCSLPYTLNANTTAVSYLWNTGSSNATVPVTNSGKYWVHATSSNGCVIADTINVVVSSYPIVTLGADTAFCSGSTINLYCGNSGSTILWNTGANTPFITVGTVGTYSVLVTNSAGCKESDVVNVSSKTKPTVSLNFTGQTHFCPTSNTPRPLTEGTPSGGTYIGSGVSGNNFIPSAAGQGNYVIIYSYTGSNGCSNTASSMLVVDPCVSVEEMSHAISLNVYPNPTSGEFTLEISTVEEVDANISISSIDGKLVYENVISGNGLFSKNINIGNLSDGIYYLSLKTKNSSRTYKILKQ